METTPRLGLWTLSPGQAQKETSINEGLHLLDAIVAGAVEEPARADPPPTPIVGTSFIIADQATGEWAGHDAALAAFTPGGWSMLQRPTALPCSRSRLDLCFDIGPVSGSRSLERLSHPSPMSRAARRWMWNLARRFRPSWVRYGRTV